MPLPRPSQTVLNTLLTTVQEMRQAEETLAALKARATTEAHALAKISDKQARLAAGVYAYWYAPEVNANDIAFGVTGQAHPGRMIKLAGPVSVGVPCDRCHQDLPIRSRAQMKEIQNRLRGAFRWPEGYRVLCAPCEADIHEERRRAYEQNAEVRQRRQRELSALPYPVYLQTEDWREMRARYLNTLLLLNHSALVCEVCNSTERRGVFHKTLEGIGGCDDLVLLCAACRDVLLGAGRIVGELHFENALSDIEAETLFKTHLAEIALEPIDD